jgi:hypothetical protein
VVDSTGDSIASAGEHEAGSKRMFDMMDTNHDGFLSEAEFNAHKGLKKVGIPAFAGMTLGDGRFIASRYFARAPRHVLGDGRRRAGLKPMESSQLRMYCLSSFPAPRLPSGGGGPERDESGERLVDDVQRAGVVRRTRTRVGDDDALGERIGRSLVRA